jgi:hypothetical protein
MITPFQKKDELLSLGISRQHISTSLLVGGITLTNGLSVFHHRILQVSI